MLRIAFIVLLAAFACNSQPDAQAVSSLYQSVFVGDFDSAVSQTRRFQYRSKVISDVVNKLINETQRNVVDYAAHLWKNDLKDAVKDFFPQEIRSIVGQHSVKLIGKRDNMVLKLDVNVDSDGDRIAFGDSNHMIGDRMAWQFIPVFDSKVYFQIYNPHANQYLKLGGSRDSDGEYKAFGDRKSGSYRHQFFLQPEMLDGELLFYIVNREYQQALKMSREVDSYGDRWVFGEHGSYTGQPNAFGWILQPY